MREPASGALRSQDNSDFMERQRQLIEQTRAKYAGLDINQAAAESSVPPQYPGVADAIEEEDEEGAGYN